MSKYFTGYVPNADVIVSDKVTSVDTFQIELELEKY